SDRKRVSRCHGLRTSSEGHAEDSPTRASVNVTTREGNEMEIQTVFGTPHSWLLQVMGENCHDGRSHGFGACLGLVAAWCGRRLKGVPLSEERRQLQQTICAAAAIQTVYAVAPVDRDLTKALQRAGLRMKHMVRGFGLLSGVRCRHHLRHSGTYMA